MKGNRVIFPDSLKTPRCPKPTGMNLMSTKSYVKILCLNGDPPSEADSYHGEFEEEEDNLLLSFYSSIKQRKLSQKPAEFMFFLYYCQYLIWTVLPLQTPYAYFYLCPLT